MSDLIKTTPIRQVELSSLDLRYQHHRLRSELAERQLLNSIISHGIRDPLQGVDAGECHILLNGFKRYRCAVRLKMESVPYQSMGGDEMMGIVELLRSSNAKSLNILEQARLIDELKSVFKLRHNDIADLLEKSIAWVSMRAGMIKQMSPLVMKKVFDGDFPAYSFMYTIRQFMRMNRVSSQEIDTFVESVSGKKLSTREIEVLAHGYFKGAEAFRQQIIEGNIHWGLKRLKGTAVDSTDCNAFESKVLRDLEIVLKYLQRVSGSLLDPRLKTASFLAQSNLLAGGILRVLPVFHQTVKAFYDRSKQT